MLGTVKERSRLQAICFILIVSLCLTLLPLVSFGGSETPDGDNVGDPQKEIITYGDLIFKKDGKEYWSAQRGIIDPSLGPLNKGDYIEVIGEWEILRDGMSKIKPGDFFIVDMPDALDFRHEITFETLYGKTSSGEEIIGDYSVLKREDGSYYFKIRITELNYTDSDGDLITITAIDDGKFSAYAYTAIESETGEDIKFNYGGNTYYGPVIGEESGHDWGDNDYDGESLTKFMPVDKDGNIASDGDGNYTWNFSVNMADYLAKLSEPTSDVDVKQGLLIKDKLPSTQMSFVTKASLNAQVPFYILSSNGTVSDYEFETGYITRQFTYVEGAGLTEAQFIAKLEEKPASYGFLDAQNFYMYIKNLPGDLNTGVSWDTISNKLVSYESSKTEPWNNFNKATYERNYEAYEAFYNGGEDTASVIGFTFDLKTKIDGKPRDISNSIEMEWGDGTTAGAVHKVHFQGADASATIINDGDVIIHKYDANSKEIMQGITFELLNEAGEVVQTRITNDAGFAHFKNVIEGTYTIRESGLPEGYDIDKLKIYTYDPKKPNELGELLTDNKFTIGVEGLQFEAYNDLKDGTAQLLKLDEDEESPIADAVFVLNGPDGYSQEGTTNENGLITWSGLKWGNYTVEEKTPAPGYTGELKFAEGSSSSFAIGLNNVDTLITLEAINERATGELELVKKNATDETILIEGAKFVLQKHDGTTFEPMQSPSGTGLWIEETDEEGKIVFGDLEWGRYRVVEYAAATGYEEGTATYSGGTDGGNVFVIGPDDTTVSMKAEITAKNTPLPGNAKLIKLSNSDKATPLSGASFVLKIGEDQYLMDEDGIKYFTSDKNGEVLFNDLPWGTYEIEEKGSAYGYEAGSIAFVDKDDNPTDGTFTINADNAGPGYAEELTFTAYNNEGLGSFSMVKYSSGSGVKGVVVGAQFELLKKSGANYVSTGKTATSGSTGHVIFNDLEWGDYQVVETTPAAGYLTGLILSGGGFFTISDEEENMEHHMIGFNERIPGSVELTKVDSAATDTKLSGAEFYLTDAKGDVVYKEDGVTTKIAIETDGVYKWTDLDWGTYTIHESKAADGFDKSTFVIDGATDNKVVIDGSNPQLTITGYNDKIKGSVELTKIDKISKTAIKGAKFMLQKEVTKDGVTTFEAMKNPNGSGNWILEAGTDGKVLFSGLDWGTYRIIEHKSAEGYKNLLKITFNSNTDGESAVFTISPTNVTEKVEIIAENERLLGKAMLKKTDLETGEPLKGAKFELRDSNNEVVINDVETNASGEAFFNDLAWGEYTIYETETVKGYALDSFTPVTFEVDSKNVEEIIELEGTNSSNKGKIILTKLDADDKTPIVGAKFRLIQDDEPYMMTIAGVLSEVIATTNSSGEAIFTGLTWGTYEIEEYEAAPGYDGILNFTEGSNPVTLTQEKIEEDVFLEAENDRLLGNVELLKEDTVNNKVLAGAKFSLENLDGTPYEDADGEVIVESDADGIAKFENLPWGTYKVIEKEAAPGYDKSSFKMDNDVFTVGALSVGQGDEPTVISLSADNSRTLGKAEIIKTDNKGENIAGAGFVLIDSDGKEVTNKNGSIMTAYSDLNGVAKFNDLDWGTYTVKEVEWATGYIENKITFKGGINKFEITAGSLGIAKVIQIEAVNERHEGKIEITKSDSFDNKPLEGAEFGLIFNGEALKDDENNLVKAKTDKNGVATFGGLEWGDYQVVELSPAQGYDGDSITISNDGKVTINAENAEAGVTFTATNDRLEGKAMIKKTAEKYGENIAGAEFYLIDSNDNVVQDENGTKTAVTNASGEAFFTGLLWDTYTVKEAKSATGYKAESIKFTNGDKIVVTSSSVENLLRVDATNERHEGKIEITKSDSFDGAKLEGAVFTLEKGGAPLTNASGEAITAKTNKNGVAVFKNLEWGTYKVLEVTPATGYAPGSLKIENEGVVHINSLNVEGELTFDATNDRIPGKLEIEKLDAEDKSKLEGAEFYLIKDGEAYETTVDGIYTIVIGKTDASGTAIFTDLPWGSYEIKELNPAKGYEAGSLKFVDGNGTFEITAGSEKEFKVTATNDRIIGSFELEKVNGVNSDIKLAGAEFYLEKLNEESGEYEQLKHKGSLLLQITDTAGMAKFEGLEWGKYRVIEHKAPEGYTIESLSFVGGTNEFEVGAEEQNIKYTAMNTEDSVLGAEDFPDDYSGGDDTGSVLGAEAKTGDIIDMALLYGAMLLAIMLLLLAVAVLRKNSSN